MSSFFSGRDPLDVLAEVEKTCGTRSQCVHRLVEVALELGVFDGAKKFYGFHDFERGIVEFGVHIYNPFDRFTGEVILPGEAGYIQIVFLGEEGVGAYLPPPAERPPAEAPPEPLVDWNHNERPA